MVLTRTSSKAPKRAPRECQGPLICFCVLSAQRLSPASQRLKHRRNSAHQKTDLREWRLRALYLQQFDEGRPRKLWLAWFSVGAGRLSREWRSTASARLAGDRQDLLTWFLNIAFRPTRSSIRVAFSYHLCYQAATGKVGNRDSANNLVFQTKDHNRTSRTSSCMQHHPIGP